MKKNVLVNILSIVAFAISLLVVIPFKVQSVGNGEGILKMAVFPLLVILLSLVVLLIRKDHKEVSKRGALGASMPVLLVLAAEFIYMMTLPLRNHAMGSDIAFNANAWKLIAFGYCFVGVVALALAFLLPVFKMQKSKAVLPFTIIAMYAALVALSGMNSVLANEYGGGDFSTSATGVFVFAIVFGVLMVAAAVAMFLLASKKAEEEVEEEPVLEEVPAEEEVEEAPEAVEEVPAEEEVEEAPEVVEEAPAEEVEKPKKEKKVIEPSVQVLAEYAATFDDVTINYAKNNENNYKVYRKKKLMCIVQSTNNDYRVTFQRKPISVANLIIKYPNAITRANKPEGEQWFKAVNKGNIEEEDLKIMIRFSHKFLVDAEAKELAKKERAKQKAKEKREKERQKAREKAQKERERQKAKEKAEKEKAEKEALKAQKAAEANEAPAQEN